MLRPIDFFHDRKSNGGYLLDPHRIHKEIINILDNKELKWTPEISKHFTFLTRLSWSISVLDTIDDYLDYSETDIVTFFVAFNTFCDIIDLFEVLKAARLGENIFKKSKMESVFTDDIINDKSDKNFVSFIRSLSFAHTTGVDRGGKFLKGNICTFILSSINTLSASPTIDEIKTKPIVFYFHVLLIKNENKYNQIFKVYISELKTYMQSLFENCNLEKIKEGK